MWSGESPLPAPNLLTVSSCDGRGVRPLCGLIEGHWSHSQELYPHDLSTSSAPPPETIPLGLGISTESKGTHRDHGTGALAAALQIRGYVRSIGGDINCLSPL